MDWDAIYREHKDRKNTPRLDLLETCWRMRSPQKSTRILGCGIYRTDAPGVPLLIIDGLGMRKLAHTAAEDLLELIMRRYERASTLLTSNRPVDDWGKLLGDTAAVTALLDRLLHHAHVLKCGPRSWRTKMQTDLRTEEGTK